ITVSSVGNVTFLPGTYVLIGGGMSVSGQSTLNGTGVTFYDTATDNKSFGPISFSGGTTGSLSAPTSGPIKGMLFFQDRTLGTPKTTTASTSPAPARGPPPTRSSSRTRLTSPATR